jgi:nucleoid-associated protein YgaU
MLDKERFPPAPSIVAGNGQSTSLATAKLSQAELATFRSQGESAAPVRSDDQRSGALAAMDQETQPPPLKAAVIFIVLVVAIVAVLTFKRKPAAPTETSVAPQRITVKKPTTADGPGTHLVGKINNVPSVEVVSEQRGPVDLAAPPPVLAKTFPQEPLSDVSGGTVTEWGVETDASSAAGPRKHRVKDGDTLATLAERYLGDPTRAGELLEANRTLISNPELLPIGVELVVPAARVEQHVDDEELAPVAPSNSAAK